MMTDKQELVKQVNWALWVRESAKQKRQVLPRGKSGMT